MGPRDLSSTAGAQWDGEELQEKRRLVPHLVRWLVDCGATHHMCYLEDLFDSLGLTDVVGVALASRDAMTPTRGAGDITLTYPGP